MTQSADMIAIRPATVADFAVWSDLWSQYLAFYETSRDADIHTTTFDRIMSDQEQMFSSLAWQGDQAVGLVNWLYHRTFWDEEDRCYLNDLFVSPDARGRHLGARLIETVKKHALGRNCAHIYWLTATDNASARRLYDRVSTLTPFVKYQV